MSAADDTPSDGAVPAGVSRSPLTPDITEETGAPLASGAADGAQQQGSGGAREPNESASSGAVPRPGSAGGRPGSRRGGVGWAGRPTAREVASLAGVSTQTVSRVANGEPNVRPETRTKVLAAMDTVGYAPNAAARALRLGRSNVIGVIVHHLTRTGEAHIVEAVAATAHARGYGVTLTEASSGAIEDVNVAIARTSQSVAGLVVLGLETAHVDRAQVPPRTPVVVADSRTLPYPTVGFDQSGGAHLATAHLLGLGHRTVHHLAGPASSLQAVERERAWRSTLEAAGRPVPEPWRGDWSPASGYEAGTRIAVDPQVTSVFAANDEMAAGLMRALHEAGRAIPGDVSVVGFDDVIGEYLWPPLTTVHQDFAAMGERLITLLLAQMGDGAGLRDTPEASGKWTRTSGPGLITPTLMVRASTAAPVSLSSASAT